MSDSNSNVTSINDVITHVSSEMTLLEAPEKIDVMMIVHSLIGCVGIVANFTVITVFGNHKKLRQKIPNIFIIHQIRFLFKFYTSILVDFKSFHFWLICDPTMV